MKKEELIKEAKRRYPVRCAVKCDFVGMSYQGIIGDEFNYTDSGIWINLIDSHLRMCLYNKFDNKWAEIIEYKFVLPKTWYVTVTKENIDVLSKWRFDRKESCLQVGYIVGMYKWDENRISKEYNDTPDSNWENEITFDQFKKYVLKENMENKKLIGYKLIKEYPMSVVLGTVVPSSDIIDFKKYSDYFEPIYKQQFKIGDYVYWSGSSPTIAIIAEKRVDDYSLNVYGNLKSHDSCHEDYLRLATKEEIEGYKSAVCINGYKLETSTACGGYAKFGCQTVTKSELEAIKTTLQVSERLIDHYNLFEAIQKDEVNVELIDKILVKL